MGRASVAERSVFRRHPLTNGGSAFCDTSTATSSNDPQPACVPSAGQGVWYQLTPEVASTVVVTTCGSDFDTVLSVYSGVCGSFTEIACNDDDSNCGTTASRVSFSGNAGQTYYILVSGYAVDPGNLHIVARWVPVVPVSNDQCSGAISLANGQPITLNTWSATATGDPSPSCAGASGKGVWYTVTPDTTRPVTVSTCGSDFNTVLAFYSGTCGALTELACNDNGTTGCAAGTMASSLTFTSSPGTPYYILVAGVNGASGNLRTSVSWGPVNDLFQDAIALSGALISVSASNIGATREPGEPDHADVPGGRSVWWSWTAPESTTTSISTAGSSFDTVLAVYTGNSVEHLTLVAANNNISTQGTGDSRVTFNAVAGTTYRLAVDGYAGRSGSIKLIINAGGSSFYARKAIYNGLFYSTNGASYHSCGFLTLATTVKGTLSGKAFITGKSHPFSGYFSRTGAADFMIYQTGISPMPVHLQIDPSDPDLLTGQIAGTHLAAGIFADRATFNAATNPSPIVGKYTLAFPGGGDSVLQPGGDGVATITVSPSGAISLTGTLADGSKITQRTILSKSAQVPFYSALYAGSGSILGWLSFEETQDHDLAGDVEWRFEVRLSDRLHKPNQ